jgi:hypothetical protein
MAIVGLRLSRQWASWQLALRSKRCTRVEIALVMNRAPTNGGFQFRKAGQAV